MARLPEDMAARASAMQLFAAGGLLVLLVGCGSGGDATTRWSGPPSQSLNGQLSISDFNDFLAGDGKAFASSPIAAVTEFLRLDKASAALTDIRASSPGEVRDHSTVVATLDGVLDVSVRTVRYTLVLHRDGRSWRVRSAEWAQVCRPGRGHLNSSFKPCV
jgi:hypothetical protein